MNSGNPEMFQDLILALLAVNHWDVEKAATITEGLRAQGLTAPTVIMSRSLEANAEHLGQAGYNRGQYMQRLMSGRIMSAAFHFMKADFARQLQRAVDEKDISALKKVLNEVEGVGNMVIDNFRMLQGIS